VNTGPLGALN